MLFRRRKRFDDLTEEIRLHIEERAEQLMREGMRPTEAREAAHRAFGNPALLEESSREVWQWPALESVVADVRLALRQMRRSPGFALTALFTLALGIAANVIVFGVLQALVLRPVELPQADRVMTLGRTDQPYPFFSYPVVRDIRDDSKVFSAVAPYLISNFGVEANGVTRAVWGCEMGGQYFEVAGIKPFLGRLLQRADDDHPGASQAAVLAWPAWKSDFGADPNIVGKTIRINKHPYTIVGVTPEGFYGTEKFIQPSLFVPIANEESLEGTNFLESRNDPEVYAVVRLKEDVTVAQAQAELNTIAARIHRQHPEDAEKESFQLVRPGLMGDFLGSPARAFLAGVMGLAGIVLLAACANLGSLFAARTADRAREIAIRMAIGSSRSRIVRQVLVEALVIAILAGACACFLAWIAITGLANWRPPTEYPMSFHILPQPSLILMTLAISILAGVVFGAMPLRQIFKTDPNEAMKSGNAPALMLGRRRRWALRDLLLAAQIALCCVTVTAAIVSLRGLSKALSMDMGFNPKHAVLTRFELNEAGYAGESAEQFQRRVLEKVSQLPGVVAAAYASSTPLSLNAPTLDVFSQQANNLKSPNRAFAAYEYGVSPGYFAAAETTLLAGRDVSFHDTGKSPLVAVVNREFARRLFHSDAAVGRYFKNESGQPVQVVGLVADGKYLTLTEDPEPAAFVPILQNPTTGTSLIVRQRQDSSIAATSELAGAVRKAIRDLDSAVPVRESTGWSSQLGLAFFASQVATVALGLFGAFGLLLSVTGTFGLASYTVGKRLRELSIRVALGAQAEQIIAAALGRMLIVLASGAVVGMLLGVATSRVLSAIVYHASAQDPLVLGAVVLTMVLTGSLSVAGPVRRALRIDPAVLLREQ